MLQTFQPKKIKKLIFVGVNVFRLNFSHGSHEDHLNTIKIIRRLETKLRFQIGILADLQGPKFRIGKVEENVKLKVNDQFIFDKDKKSFNINLEDEIIEKTIIK